MLGHGVLSQKLEVTNIIVVSRSLLLLLPLFRSRANITQIDPELRIFLLWMYEHWDLWVCVIMSGLRMCSFDFHIIETIREVNESKEKW